MHRKLQDIIQMLFEAEFKYRSAAKEVQMVSLSRFLNHQNIIRNQYAHQLWEACTYSSDDFTFEPRSYDLRDTEEFNLNRHSIRFRYIPLISRCLAYDQEILKKCTKLVKKHTIPIDILEVLTKTMTYLIFQGVEGEDIIEEIRLKQQQDHYKRFTNFNKAMYLN